MKSCFALSAVIMLRIKGIYSMYNQEDNSKVKSRGDVATIRRGTQQPAVSDGKSFSEIEERARGDIEIHLLHVTAQFPCDWLRGTEERCGGTPAVGLQQNAEKTQSTEEAVSGRFPEDFR